VKSTAAQRSEVVRLVAPGWSIRATAEEVFGKISYRGVERILVRPVWVSTEIATVRTAALTVAAEKRLAALSSAAQIGCCSRYLAALHARDDPPGLRQTCSASRARLPTLTSP
jgi:hypothetical protein